MTDELFPEWKYTKRGLRLGKPKDPWGDYPIDAVFAEAGDRISECDVDELGKYTLTPCRATRTILHNECNEYIKGWQALIDEGAIVLEVK